MTPYGYLIQDGKAVIDPVAAENVRRLFCGYLSGLSIARSAERANLPVCPATAGHMLKNTIYLGNSFYPSIIDRETFESAQSERQRRYDRQGRFGNAGPLPPRPVRKTFQMIPGSTQPTFTAEEYLWHQNILKTMRNSAIKAACLYNQIHHSPEGDVKLNPSDKARLLNRITPKERE